MICIYQLTSKSVISHVLTKCKAESYIWLAIWYSGWNELSKMCSLMPNSQRIINRYLRSITQSLKNGKLPAMRLVQKVFTVYLCYISKHTSLLEHRFLHSSNTDLNISCWFFDKRMVKIFQITAQFLRTIQYFGIKISNYLYKKCYTSDGCKNFEQILSSYVKRDILNVLYHFMLNDKERKVYPR